MSSSSRRSLSGQTTESRVFTQLWKNVAAFLKPLSKAEKAALACKSYKETGFLYFLVCGVNRSHYGVSYTTAQIHGKRHYATTLGTKTGRHQYVVDFKFRHFDPKSPWPLVESIEDYKARVAAL